jgi:hypothetical protein
MRHFIFGLAGAAVLVCSLQAGLARAEISVTNNTDANALVNALLSGGTGGITVTNAVLSAQDNGNGAQSSGIYTAGSNNYQLPIGQGVVITSGNAGSPGPNGLSSGPVVQSLTTAYTTDATPDQNALLKQVSPNALSFHDVTELTITFNVSATTSKVFFGGAFASAEYPQFTTANGNPFIDGFGLFLNGTNIATVGGKPVNVDSPFMFSTVPPFLGDPANTQVATQFQETPLQSVLVDPVKNSPDLSFSGDVVPGSTDNTLTFIVADANDHVLDTAFFIHGLGNAPPTPTVPEPSTFAVMGLSAVAMGLFYRRSKKQTSA